MRFPNNAPQLLRGAATGMLIAGGLTMATPAVTAEPAVMAEPAAAAESAPEAEPAAVVDMPGGLKFDPDEVTISVGDTIEWRNSSSVVHTVTADPQKAANADNVRLPEGAETFDSGNILPGENYTYTFTVPGRYKYVCLPHEAAGMIGEVVVQQ